MKRYICFLLLLILSMLYTLPAFADVIWEPEDDFYWANAEDCVPVNRTFIAASSMDAINVYVSPENTSVVNTITNNTEIFISWSWNEWYYYDIGWIHSDDVTVVYDNISFIEDNEISDYDGEEMSLPVVQLYTYPNSGNSYELIEEKDYSLIGGSFSSSYIDANGLNWGYISYYMQHEGWVCIDDPTNTSLNSGAVPTDLSISQKRGSDAEVPNTHYNVLLIATVLTVAVVSATLFLLIYKRKKVK